jgi:zinc protease
MRKTAFACSAALIVILTMSSLSRAIPLEVPRLDDLGLPAEMEARVGRVLPSQPGDTFLELRNGMTILVRETHASRVVSCEVLVRTGSIYEGRYFFGGISHYLEHVVAGGSTSSFTENEAQERLKAMGGASNAYTSHDRTVYYINTTAAHYLDALKLLFSYVSECRLTPREVAREKAVIQQEFKLMENDPGRELWQLFLRTAYRNHPVRHPVIGYEEVFVNISREDLLSYYRQRYTPENMVVAVVGAVNTAEAVRTMLSLSEGTGRNFQPPVATPWEPEQNAPRWAEKSFAAAKLTEMKVGFPTVSLSHPDLYALDVLAIVLGTGRTSRLYRELKDKRNLVLGVDTFSWTPSYAPGLFGCSLSLDRDNLDETLAVLWQEIERIQREPVAESELEKAKRRVIADSVFSRQTAAQMASSLAHSFAATGDPYFDSLYVEAVRSISREDVRRVARTYLQKQMSTVAVLSPVRKASASERPPAAEAVGKITKRTLDNGLTVLLRRNATVPIVQCQVFGKGGQRFEPEQLPGVSLFMATLLTKGTQSRSKQQIAQAIEGLGGSLSASSGRNTYSVSLAVLKDDYQVGLELLADVLQHPVFPQTEIEKQRKDTLLSIQRLDENWQQELGRLFRKHYYQQHPYANDLLGTKRSIREISRGDIQQFYRRTVMPNNAVLAIFGDIDPEEVADEVNSLFGGWASGTLLEPQVQEVTTPLSADTSVQKETDKVSAGILIGTNGISLQDPDRPTLDVIDAVLSGIGYPSGWLHGALRGGERSLVYVIHAYPGYGIDGGHFSVLTQTTMANYERVVEIVLEKLEEIQQRPLDEEELEAAKDMCITMHEMSLESNGAQARSAALNEALGLGYSWDFRYPELIRQVGARDALRVARELFRHHLLVSTLPEHPVEAIIPPKGRERLHVR